MPRTRATSAASLLLFLALATVATADYYVPHVPTPTTYTSLVPHVPKTPKTPHVQKPELTIAVEGTVLCKSGYNTFPILGAKVKVVCPVVNLYGKVEAEVKISSNPTDAKGHFLLALHGLSDKVKNINACKVKLESSPLPTCNIATNVNLGITGAPLLSSHLHIQIKANLKLYTVGPFFFTGSKAPEPGK